MNEHALVHPRSRRAYIVKYSEDIKERNFRDVGEDSENGLFFFLLVPKQWG